MAKIPTILQGDESGEIRINLDEAHSYAGARLVVAYQGITRTFENLEAGSHVALVFTHDETAAFVLGTFPILARLIGAAGSVETVENADMRIKVTDCLGEVNAGGSFSIVPGQGYVPITDDGDLPARSNLVDVINKVNEIVHTLAQRSAVSLLAIAACAFTAFGASVQKADIGTLYPGEMVVTNVDLSGGGGGVDTNDVKGIVRDVLSTNGIRSVSGAARPLPRHLHALDFADSYTNEAAAYYRSRGNGKTDGGCSSVRDGGFLYRNFDYPFDDRAEFVVKMSAGKGRFASVGVAQVGTNLTEQFVTSGKWSKWYKALPGATVDGINENGVACNINVVDGDPQTSGWHNDTGDLNPLAAIRWILDNATNAQHAAEYIAAHIRFPQGWTQNFHYMIADEEKTYIVENGDFETVDWDTTPAPVITNFKVFGEPDVLRTGVERYSLLYCGSPITNAWYTNAYRPDTSWLSDFNGSETLMETSKVLWAQKPKEAHRGETFEGHTWWQTVHTSIYDLTNRVIRVAVQETDDWYTFQVPSSGAKVDAYTKAETDEKISEDIEANEKTGTLEQIVRGERVGSGEWAIVVQEAKLAVQANEATSALLDGEGRDIAETYAQKPSYPTSGNLASLDENGNLADSGKKPGDFRETTDNTCHRDQLGDVWTCDPPLPAGYKIVRYSDGTGWEPELNGNPMGAGKQDPDNTATTLSWAANEWQGGYAFTATRATVSKSGEPFVTECAISINNPAFVSAVRNTPTENMPEDMPTDWGTYGTVGAALAALAAFVKWAKSKIVAVIGNDGKPTDTFATDLLAKPVAIQKIDERLPIPISAKNAGFTTESYKRFVVTVGGNMTVTLHTPTAKQGGGYDAEVFECRFDGASLAADASISFVGATATTMDTNCGTVTAGKVALMSAFWNGTTWDVNWKVEG